MEKLEALLKRLTSASAAAFDVSQLSQEPLLKEIEAKLDEYVNKLMALKEISPTIQKRMENKLVKGVHG